MKSRVVLSLYCLVAACGLEGTSCVGCSGRRWTLIRVSCAASKRMVKVFHSTICAAASWRPSLSPSTAGRAMEGVRDVGALPHQCPQLKVAGLHIGHEDCLYLHVCATKCKCLTAPTSDVLDFGGGYVIGDAYEFGYYDGKNLARNTGSIIVAINYRLGPLGFLALPSLLNESGTTGNLALQDQRADCSGSKEILAPLGQSFESTIFGESAGAFSVCWHTVNNESRGLFSRPSWKAVTAMRENFSRTCPRRSTLAHCTLRHIGCNTSRLTSTAMNDCLRKAPLGKIMNESGLVRWKMARKWE